MARDVPQPPRDSTAADWVPFPGGELEGRRPHAICRTCRRLGRGRARPDAQSAICFECYRAELERARALEATRHLETASEVRFQFSLPFDPIDRPRLERLKAERVQARTVARVGAERFAERRRRAQIAARHAVRLALDAERGPALAPARTTAAIHAAELQLPESWLPFVVRY